MDIALEDIKYINTLSKIRELEENLQTFYNKLNLDKSLIDDRSQLKKKLKIF